MEENENLFEKLDDIIRKKKEEIAGLRKLIHYLEDTPPEPKKEKEGRKTRKKNRHVKKNDIP
jgi:hypothetical protein